MNLIYLGLKRKRSPQCPDKEGKKCDFVTAEYEYTLCNDVNIGVVNSRRSENGETKRAKGVGRVTDKQTNSRLEINLGPEFLGFLPCNARILIINTSS